MHRNDFEEKVKVAAERALRYSKEDWKRKLLEMQEALKEKEEGE
jgi:hypothetical protein